MNQTIRALGLLAALALPAACGVQNRSLAPAASSAAAAKAAIKARQELMESFKKDLGTMGKMVKGETAYDAAAFRAAAENLAANAAKTQAHYTVPTADDSDSKAKPEVWSRPEEFKQEADTFSAAAAALKTAAASGRFEDVKKPFGRTAQSCKSCHSTFRAD